KKSPMLIHRTTALAAVFAFSAAANLLAGDSAITSSNKSVVAPAEEKTWCERLWEYPTIYKNEESAFLNEFRFVGRAHFDEYSIDSDRGYDQDWIVRRLRIGIKARFFHHLDLHVETDLNPQSQFVGYPAYQRLTDAYLAWKFSDAAKLTVGKQSVKFTLDGATSSNELITIDRNNLANNVWFTTEYVPGVSLSGRIKDWQYNAGVFSGGKADKEFGEFNAGTFELLSLGYDFGKLLNVKKALLRADYVHNEQDADSTFTKPFENVGALVFQLENGSWGFSAEVAGGSGFPTQSDVWGVTIMPWYNITKNIQAVLRYNYIESEDPRGVRLARYDTFVTGQRGDEYHEIYGGLNYYICGHRLKVQTGVSYVSLNDTTLEKGEYHAWQWTTGLRLSF
ncbi:MAG: porin, partial [Chthoniobacteraceae bacterium]